MGNHPHIRIHDSNERGEYKDGRGKCKIGFILARCHETHIAQGPMYTYRVQRAFRHNPGKRFVKVEGMIGKGQRLADRARRPAERSPPVLM